MALAEGTRMFNPAIVYSAVLLVSAPAGQEAAALGVSIRRPAPNPDIVGTYQELRALNLRERRTRLEELPSDKKADLWNHHLRAALAEHPEFTSEQRSVIRDALSLLTLELFAIDPSDPRWGTTVDQPLRRLKHRARAVFDSRTARELFLQLG